MIRVNLMGLPKERKRVRAPLITFEGGVPLILLAVVILAVAGYTYYQRQGLQQQIAVLTMEIDDLNRELLELQRIKEQYDENERIRAALQARIDVIDALNERRSGPVDLLSTLATAVVNDETNSLWLTGFVQTGQTVTIEGTALNVRVVADFLTRLLNARIFATVDLQEASQDPAQPQAQRFSFILNGQLATPPVPETAAVATPAG